MTAMNIRSDEERRKVVAEIKSLVLDQDITVEKACRQKGVGIGSFYTWLKRYGEKPLVQGQVKRTYTKKAKPTLTEIPVARTSNVLAFYGNPKEIAEIVRHLT